jgi:hypothetical protein
LVRCGEGAELLDELGTSRHPQGSAVRGAFDHDYLERREDRRELLHRRQVGVGAADESEGRHLDGGHVRRGDGLLAATAYHGCHRKAIIACQPLLRLCLNLLVRQLRLVRWCRAQDHGPKRNPLFEFDRLNFRGGGVLRRPLLTRRRTTQRRRQEPRGMRDEELCGDARPHRVPYDVRPGDVQVIQEPHHILAQLDPVALGVMGLVALAVSAGVKRDDPVVRG